MVLLRILLVLAMFIVFNTGAMAQQPQAKCPPGQMQNIPMPPMKNLSKQKVGDYQFELVSSQAMGWYEPREGQLVWVDPIPNTNMHLEVILTNIIDLRPLPNASVTVSILDANNRIVETKPMIMLWSLPGYHYGNNFTVPAQGNYTVTVNITPPMIARHHKTVGNRFYTPAQVSFQNVPLKPEGQFKE